jgi:hypothetical protein
MSIKEQIVSMKKKAPGTKATDIAESLTVSREYVRQVLKSNNLCTHQPRKEFICNQCGKVFPAKHGGSPKFCCRDCWKLYHKVTLICEQCGKSFYRQQSDFLAGLRKNSDTKKFFCTKRCQGHYVAEHYGFIAHPENTENKRQWDYNYIRQLRNSGLKLREIKSLTGIGQGTLDYILYKSADRPEKDTENTY